MVVMVIFKVKGIYFNAAFHCFSVSFPIVTKESAGNLNVKTEKFNREITFR